MSVADEDDVIADAHNTFLNGNKIDKELDIGETQMDMIMKYDNAFDWNEDDDQTAKALRNKSLFSQAKEMVKSVLATKKRRMSNGDNSQENKPKDKKKPSKEEV